MIDLSDPTGCQAAAGFPRLSYLGDQIDAKKRLKQKQSQVLCAVCERWRWSDRRCKDFVEEKKCGS